MSDMRFWYPASITQITSVNDSFDSCILSICYAGRNRNKTNISKEAIENAIPTMAYCPIVANYDVSADAIGGHDVGFVEREDGTVKMVNLTDAVGVIPENPQWCWQKKTDNDGVEREYLSTPAILWKRTPVYEKLKREGVSGQSMEINVKDGRVVDGLFEIVSFEFTAFCLLGDDVEPCFEGAQVEMFSMNNLSTRLSEMMDDFKKNYSKVIAASADDDITPSGDQKKLEGGESSLNIEELLQKYGLTAEDVDFETDGLSAEEIENRFANIHAAKFEEESGENEGETGENAGEEGNGENAGEAAGNGDGAADQNNEGGAQEPDQNDNGEESTNPVGTDDDSDETRRRYSLTGEQMWNEIIDALHTIMYVDEWGEWPRYNYTDYDPAVNEIYAYDNEDWNLYGFKYTMNGDRVVIDFESKKRKKLAFVDYDNGDAQFSYKHMLDSANAKFASLASEVKALREYKKNIEDANRKAKEEEVFAKFADLVDDDRFKSLRENCSDMSIQDIEDKCFAIRGRNAQIKFSQAPATPVRLPVERDNKNVDPDEPYGGIFVKYGIANR